MSEFDNLVSVIKKDWETVPGISKIIALTSLISCLYVLSAWQTEKSKGWFLAITITINLTVLVFLRFTWPYLLRRKYSVARLKKGDLEVIVDGGIWFLVDHSKNRIRWIANMLTAVEMGLRNSSRHSLDEGQSMFDYLESKEKKPKEYRVVKRLLIAGRPGKGIEE